MRPTTNTPGTLRGDALCDHLAAMLDEIDIEDREACLGLLSYIRDRYGFLTRGADPCSTMNIGSTTLLSGDADMIDLVLNTLDDMANWCVDREEEKGLALALVRPSSWCDGVEGPRDIHAFRFAIDLALMSVEAVRTNLLPRREPRDN